MNTCSTFYENLTDILVVDTKSLMDEPVLHIRPLLLYSDLRKLAREKLKVIWKRDTCDNEAVCMQAMTV
jgi:hypothetical protein